jgi:hypothetical protein
MSPMLEKDNFGLSELHETIRRGERALIHRMGPEDIIIP